jgi:uncharacterized membrane protein
MHDLMLLLHLAAAIIWMGGMSFMLLALRPAAHAHLQPPARLPFMAAVLQRFLALVGASIAVLLATGVWLLKQAPAGATPPGWHAMAVLGVLMVAIFGYLYWVPYRRLQIAVAAGDWPEGGKRVGQIATLAKINSALGWLAIAGVLLWRG